MGTFWGPGKLEGFQPFLELVVAPEASDLFSSNRMQESQSSYWVSCFLAFWNDFRCEGAFSVIHFVADQCDG